MSHHQYHNDGLAVTPFRPGWLLAGLVVFGISFGFIEAVVVVDLRAILGPVAGWTGALSAGEIFPMIGIDRLEQADPTAARLMRIEICARPQPWHCSRVRAWQPAGPCSNDSRHS